MRKIILIILSVLFFSCQKTWWEESEFIQAPNWTPDNKILFLQEIWRTKHFRDIWGGAGIDEMISEIYLWEVDTLQHYKRLGMIFKIEGRYVGFSYLSCAGDWILISGDTDTNIYAIKRSTLEKRYLEKGMFADLSPDGNKFVYVKPNKGLWIKNIDGTNDHQIIADSNATHPAWSSDGGRIAYNSDTLLIVSDTNGNILKSFVRVMGGIDWGPSDSNALCGTKNLIGRILYYETEIVDTLPFKSGGGLRWSPSGGWFIGYDRNGWFVIKRNGTNKWYIKP